jgi:hypothetical protein
MYERPLERLGGDLLPVRSTDPPLRIDAHHVDVSVEDRRKEIGCPI